TLDRHSAQVGDGRSVRGGVPDDSAVEGQGGAQGVGEGGRRGGQSYPTARAVVDADLEVAAVDDWAVHVEFPPGAAGGRGRQGQPAAAEQFGREGGLEPVRNADVGRGGQNRPAPVPVQPQVVQR